jgi:hypothetical protein
MDYGITIALNMIHIHQIFIPNYYKLHKMKSTTTTKGGGLRDRGL